MKKIVLMLVVVSMLTLSMTGCFGSFKATRWLYSQYEGLNQPISTLVMWVTIWYGVPFLGFVDIVILNTLEFWTGSNPLAMSEGEMDIRHYSQDGKDYDVVLTHNKIDIIERGNPVNNASFVYETNENAWYLHDSKGEISLLTETVGNITYFFDLDGKNIVTRISQ